MTWRNKRGHINNYTCKWRRSKLGKTNPNHHYFAKLLKKETIFCERVDGKFTLRRGFNIKKGARVLIIEDVITTGKSSLECVKLIKKSKAKLIGFASIIDRSTKQSLKIKTGITSHLKIDVPTFKANKLPPELKSIPITTPGSRFIK